jgi:hypothetical protein
MRLLSAFLRSASSSWSGIMGGIGGIVFTALSFYVDSSTQRTAFATIALLSLFVAFFQVWKREHLTVGEPKVTFEVDFWKSRVLLNGLRESERAKGNSTPKYIELSLRIRFINRAVHPRLIREVNAQLMERKRFGKTTPVDELIKSISTEIKDLLDQRGLSVPGQSQSDYYLFKWSLRMPDDFLMTLRFLKCFVRIGLYALEQPPLRIDFAINHWSNGVGAMLKRIE